MRFERKKKLILIELVIYNLNSIMYSNILKRNKYLAYQDYEYYYRTCNAIKRLVNKAKR